MPHPAGALVLGWQVDTLGSQICAQALPMRAQGSSVRGHCRSEACSEAVDERLHDPASKHRHWYQVHVMQNTSHQHTLATTHVTIL